MLHAVVLIVAVIGGYYSLQSDQRIIARDVARHEAMLQKLIDTESQLTGNQARVTATLEGIQRLLEEHMRSTVPSPKFLPVP